MSDTQSIKSANDSISDASTAMSTASVAETITNDASNTPEATRVGKSTAQGNRAEALQQIVAWKQQYQSQLAPSPLEDITKLAAQLELTHAHPSGIAQLFASGKVTLKALFRDAGMLRAAGRRLDRVFEDRDMKAHESGVSELSLIVGVALWNGNHVPVPVSYTHLTLPTN